MAYIKVSQLPVTTTIADTDVIMVIDNGGFPPVSKQITFGNFLASITGNASFGAAVSGLLPTIANSGNNRILTSTGSSTGMNAEGNLTFDGSLLHVSGSIRVDGQYYDSNNSTGVSGQVLISTSSGTDWITLNVGTNGTGVANYVARWLDIDTIGTGILYDTGSGVGIGITSPTGQLQVIGTGNFDVIGFNTNPGVNLSQGQIDWNDTEGTLNVAITNDTDIHIGAHQLIRVRNATGSPLYKGQAVYASGVHANGIINPALYVANNSVPELRFIGLMLENLSNNNNGFVIDFGHMENIDTRGNVASNIAVGDETWADGDILYVHPTGAGKLTKVEPKYAIPVAIILDSANNGKLFIDPRLYGTIGDLHDVDTLTATNGEFLQYNAASGYWIPSTTGNFTSLSVSGNLNVSTTGDINVLKINKLYHQNLSVATGVADSSLLITIVDPTGTPTTQVISGSGLRNSLLNQPAVLRFRQGTEAERILFTPASGEPIWTTDSQKFYIGDGSTAGGDFMGPSPYARSSGTQSITALNTNCVSSGDYSSVLGGQNNKIQSVTTHALICGGQDNLIDSDTNNHCSVIGGQNNKITGYSAFRSTIVGGYSNTISSASSYNSVIGGGDTNTLSGNYNNNCVIAGGSLNTISSTYNSFSTIGGGASNSINGSASLYVNSVSTIAGGSTNTITGDRSYNTIGGGYSNYIDSQGEHGSTIAGGYDNTIIGDFCGGSTIGGGKENNIGSGNTGGYWSTIGGGNGNKITGINYCTIPGGYFAKATRHGELSHAAGRFSNEGDAQHTTLIARKATNTNTANQVLFLDDSSARLTIPAKTTWTFEVKLSAYNDTDSAGAGWIFRGAIRRNGSNGTALIGTVVTESWQDSAMSSTSAGVVADDTNEALEIRVTGLTSKLIRWVAVVDISQVSYGTP